MGADSGTRQVSFIWIYVLLALLLIVRVGLAFLIPNQKYKPGSVVTLETVLDREPGIVSGRQMVRADDLTVYALIVPQWHFGDRLKIEGRVECGQLGKDCNRLVISKPAVVSLGEVSLNPWQKLAFTVRTRYLELYLGLFDRDQASLLSGVVLGSSGLDRQFKDKLADVGLTHVVAASGMNVSLFSGFVLWMLSLLKVRQIYKAILVGIMMLFYSTITGFEPPIVRAAVMASFTIIGGLSGRQNSSLGGLLTAAYLMLWASPKLIMSISFLLSFSAMTGQTILSSSSVEVRRGESLVADIISVLTRDFRQSVAAILATFPIVLTFFAKFSLVSVFTNALVLWTVEPLMILGGIAGIVGMVSMKLAGMIALPTGVLLDFFLWVVNFFGREEFLLKLNVSWLFVVGYYFLLAGVVWWWKVSWKEDRIVKKGP